MPLRHYHPGDAFPTGSDRLNITADAVNWVTRRMGDKSQVPEHARHEPDRCLIRNGTCDNFRRLDVVRIDSPAAIPSAGLEDWAQGLPAFLVTTPESTQDRIAIVEEPAESCGVGLAIVSGLVRTRVNMTSEGHKYARPAAGSTRLQSTSDATAPVEIIWAEPGTGEKYADVLLSHRDAYTAPAAPVPDAPLIDPEFISTCTGQGKWVWSESLREWVLVSNDCAARTATTTTSTTTTSGPTTTTTPCCPFPATYAGRVAAGDVPTTTTPEPTTTTTPDCQPLYPDFCGTIEGECTYTYCSDVPNEPPDCPDPDATTTTTEDPGPTTSTTCDCDDYTPRPNCTEGCKWVGLPTSTGSWRWHRTENNCDPICPCFQPDEDPFCNHATTPCRLRPPPPPPPEPVCRGKCSWIWVIKDGSGTPLDQGVWWRTTHTCAWWGRGLGHWLLPGCHCATPSQPGGPCGEYTETPCLAPERTTTTTLEEFDWCDYYCWGIGTPPDPPEPTTTTTVAPDCGTGGCYYRSNETADGWVGPELDSCPEECPCEPPLRNPYDDCEVIRRYCTGSPTTTTTQDCEEGNATWTCQELTVDGDTYHDWVLTESNCEGSCPDEQNCIPKFPYWEHCYDAEDVGSTYETNCRCADPPPPPPTTTTAAPTTTTTAAPTTTTTAAPTTTTTAAPTTTTTEPGTGACCILYAGDWLCYDDNTQQECEDNAASLGSEWSWHEDVLCSSEPCEPTTTTTLAECPPPGSCEAIGKVTCPGAEGSACIWVCENGVYVFQSGTQCSGVGGSCDVDPCHFVEMPCQEGTDFGTGSGCCCDPTTTTTGEEPTTTTTPGPTTTTTPETGSCCYCENNELVCGVLTADECYAKDDLSWTAGGTCEPGACDGWEGVCDPTTTTTSEEPPVTTTTVEEVPPTTTTTGEEPTTTTTTPEPEPTTTTTPDDPESACCYGGDNESCLLATESYCTEQLAGIWLPGRQCTEDPSPCPPNGADTTTTPEDEEPGPSTTPWTTTTPH